MVILSTNAQVQTRLVLVSETNEGRFVGGILRPTATVAEKALRWVFRESCPRAPQVSGDILLGSSVREKIQPSCIEKQRNLFEIGGEEERN